MKPLLGAIFILVYMLAVTPAWSATLYMNPRISDIHPGDSVAVAVRLDTDTGECINAVSGVISYQAALQPVDISLGKSIFPIWVEEPVINTADNQITFAGGIPNGYCGRIEGDPQLTNTLFEIIFQAPGFRIGAKSDSPTSSVQFTDQTVAFLNDGAGTEAVLGTIGAEIFVHDKPGAVIDNNWNQQVSADKQPPQQFSVSLEQDGSAFGGKYYIVFNTTDKQTGLDHYEVIEESSDSDSLFSWGAATAPWRVARSPYVLQDQTLNSVIRVKAVDKAGNEYIATLIPEEDNRSMSDATKIMYGFIISGVIVGAVFIGAFAMYHIRSRRRADQFSE